MGCSVDSIDDIDSYHPKMIGSTDITNNSPSWFVKIITSKGYSQQKQQFLCGGTLVGKGGDSYR